MHPAWTFPAAAIFAHLPVALVETFVLGTITYFMAGMWARDPICAYALRLIIHAFTIWSVSGLTYEASRYFYFVMGTSLVVMVIL